MATPTQETDPTGVAALIVAMVTPTLTLLALLLGWTTELSTAVLTTATALINSGVALWAILVARRHAYAPATVERIRQADAVLRPDLPPPGV